MAKNYNFIEMVKFGKRPGEKDINFGMRVLAAAETITGRCAKGTSHGKIAARGGRLPNIMMVSATARTNTSKICSMNKMQLAAQNSKRCQLQLAASIIAEAAGIDQSLLRGSSSIEAIALRLHELFLK